MTLCYPQMTLSADPLTSMMTLDTINAFNADAVALTNRTLLGAHAFWHSVTANHGHPVMGLTIDIQPHDHVVTLFLYAQNNEGWQNLMKLSSAIETSGTKIVPLNWFEAYARDCYIVFPLQLGWSVQGIQILMRNMSRKYLKGGVARTNGEHHVEEDTYVNEMNRYDIPIIAIQEIRYPNKDDSFAFDVLRAIGAKEKLPDITRTEPTLFAPTIEQWDNWYSDHPEWLRNMWQLLFDCQVDLRSKQTYMPEFPTEEPIDALRSLCERGLIERGTNSPAHNKRLDMELSVIEQMKYSDYFLIVGDFMQFAKREGIMTGPGRGSSASSLVAYSLYITDVDPLKYDLLFERFLNPNRVSLPDIDIDFEDERRHEVIEYVHQKYGMNHVAQIITMGTLSAKAVSRDVGRVFGFTNEESSLASTFISEHTLRESWANRTAEFNQFVMQSERHKTWLRTASKLEGLPRNLSTHAAGIVLCPVPLVDVIPLTKGQGTIHTTQWPMAEVENSGLLKMDFLGLRNLTFLKSILSMVEEDINLETINLQDKKTLQLFRNTDTLGIFQFESEGMRDALFTIQPDSFEDLAAISALHRPGPMQYISEYAKRKHGQAPIHYPHESTVPILNETYGIMVYQEQIMQVASQVAGYSYGEADLLRRAVSKKDRNVLENERRRFVECAASNAMPMQDAEQVYANIVKFADYGFPKSHAVAYTLISFQLGFLKANYPLEFYAALLNHTRGDVSEIINEMKQRGIQFTYPNVLFSKLDSLPGEHHVNLGLNLIKGVPKQAKELIIDHQENGWNTIFEFAFDLTEKYFTEKIIEPLAKSGALEGFGNRRTILNTLPSAVRFLKFNNELTYTEAILLGRPKYEESIDFTKRQKLEQEFEAYGFYLSGHPIEHVKEDVDFIGASISFCRQAQQGTDVEIIGIVDRVRRIKTKKKDSMAFLTIQDETGSISCTLFPRQFDEYRTRIKEHAILRLTGTIEWRNEEAQLIIQTIQGGNYNENR